MPGVPAARREDAPFAVCVTRLVHDSQGLAPGHPTRPPDSIDSREAPTAHQGESGTPTIHTTSERAARLPLGPAPGARERDCVCENGQPARPDASSHAARGCCQQRAGGRNCAPAPRTNTAGRASSGRDPAPAPTDAQASSPRCLPAGMKCRRLSQEQTPSCPRAAGEPVPPRSPPLLRELTASSPMPTRTPSTRARSAAATEAKASGGQNAVDGPLKGQSGRGGRMKRNRSLMPGRGRSRTA